MVKIILDSNFLMASLHLGIDILRLLQEVLERSVEPIVLIPVFEELREVAKRDTTKAGREANFALRIVEKCILVEVEKRNDETVDDLILRTAKAWRCPVATNDRNLRRRLRKLGIPVVYVREKSYLAMDGSID
ncbi:30S processome protein Utp24 [Candidatus Bathyarchaeota archaeon]|nr:30S processome protein Utp24 [Candidatus Bathyarchaeota archaeon]MBS7627412.1 30S processome protein Utp24 [Candidatus Bathyarchaeota archaeon]